MKHQDAGEDKKDEILYQICDKNTCEAIDRLMLVNKAKCGLVKARVMHYFEEHRTPVDYESYKKLISGIDTEASVRVQRRSNFYDLDCIEDSESE